MHEGFVELLLQMYHTRRPAGAKSWEKHDTASINPSRVDGEVDQIDSLDSVVLEERASVT